MENDTEPRTISGFVQWSMKPPQAYAMYLICLVLIGGLSFYAGTLKPKKAVVIPQQTTAPVSVPRN